MNKYLFGLHEEYNQETLFLAPEAYEAFLKLKEMAFEENINLLIVSGFRSFYKQRDIWNAKALGKRDLLSDIGDALNYKELSKQEIIKAILRWSALPGFSRHHWGSDFDVIDQMALDHSPHYQVKLIPSEYEKEGIFARLGHFLDKNLDQTQFFRPYKEDLGGVAREPWHLSYRPLSQEYFNQLDINRAYEFLEGDDFNQVVFSKEIKNQFNDIFKRYILNISTN